MKKHQIIRGEMAFRFCCRLKNRPRVRSDERATGARLRVALSALAVTEYFRDEKNQDVLLFVDNIFRFSQAGSEVSALLGRTPSAVGYQPTLARRWATSRNASLRPRKVRSRASGRLCACRRFDRSAPATTFAHLDATIVLERSIAELGIIPPLIHWPRTPARWHLKSSARNITMSPAAFRSSPALQGLQDIIAILGMDELTRMTSSPSSAS